MCDHSNESILRSFGRFSQVEISETLSGFQPALLHTRELTLNKSDAAKSQNITVLTNTFLEVSVCHH